MWAISIEAKSHIAVMTQNAIAFWETIISQPAIHILAWNRKPMLSASTVDVINGKKFVSFFAAALAFCTVMAKDFLSNFPPTCFRTLIGKFFMGEIKLFAPLMLLFWICPILFLGIFESFFSILCIPFLIVPALISLLAFFTPTMQSGLSVGSFLALKIFESSRKSALALRTSLGRSIVGHNQYCTITKGVH